MQKANQPYTEYIFTALWAAAEAFSESSLFTQPAYSSSSLVKLLFLALVQCNYKNFFFNLRFAQIVSFPWEVFYTFWLWSEVSDNLKR